MRRGFGTKTIARHQYSVKADNEDFDLPVGNRVTGSSPKNSRLPVAKHQPVGAADSTWGNGNLVKIHRANKSVNL